MVLSSWASSEVSSTGVSSVSESAPSGLMTWTVMLIPALAFSSAGSATI